RLGHRRAVPPGEDTELGSTHCADRSDHSGGRAVPDSRPQRVVLGRRLWSVRAHRARSAGRVVRSRLVSVLALIVFPASWRPRSHIQFSAKLRRPQGLVGLGVCPSLFPFPKTRGCGAPEQTRKKKTRLSSAPPAFPAFAFHGARTRTSPVVAGGVAPGSARGCSCEPRPRVPVPVPPS